VKGLDTCPRVWAIGDIHGARSRLIELLGEAEIIDARGHWVAGQTIGICLGDYFDYGEDGAGVAMLLHRLQQEARQDGGDLIPLLGNHDVLMCGLLTERQRTPYGDVASRWLLNGGRFLDLEALEHHPDITTWLRNLPTMACIGETLYLHSDTVAYCELGTSIAEVNATVRAILHSENLDRMAELFDLLCRRGELHDEANLDRMLAIFGGDRLVHGHSPIFACEPKVLYGGRCINIDGGLWDSDEAETLGFVYWL
jgi:hypothetical protein